ncbi:hypothetical protein CPB83DRAFT_853319 [Crepidotus variabilis]|uniref:Uncharacterized protein n=1 Tax=Crepidotus variabilis TaxID=179855 RepID=A0A9P6EGI7_9AGAR|nr:hypothetical protein CPB83DRAFT_853319 [Crepidotus variabilis]
MLLSLKRRAYCQTYPAFYRGLSTSPNVIISLLTLSIARTERILLFLFYHWESFKSTLFL